MNSRVLLVLFLMLAVSALSQSPEKVTPGKVGDTSMNAKPKPCGVKRVTSFSKAVNTRASSICGEVACGDMRDASHCSKEGAGEWSDGDQAAATFL